MNRIICDSSSLITLLESCLFGVLEKLTKNANIEFIIPNGVKEELIERPRGIRRFEFTALRSQKALEQGVFTVYDGDLSREVEVIDKLVNETFSSGKKNLKILHLGELEALALTEKIGCNNLLVDEKTTRLLIESPAQIQKRLEKKLRRKISRDNSKIREINQKFKGIDIIRSAELVAYAFKTGLVKDITSTREGLRAILYRLRFDGCSITDNEIEEYPSLVF